MFYSLHPHRLLGAKRLVVAMPGPSRRQIGEEWIELAGQFATIAWRGPLPGDACLMAHEHALI
jgi:hypothetical protein